MAGTPKGVENVIISTLFRRLTAKLVDNLWWLKQPENNAIYNDVRGFLSYVKTWHGSTFRRVVLSAMLDSAKKLVKTQYKIEVDNGMG